MRFPPVCKCGHPRRFHAERGDGTPPHGPCYLRRTEVKTCPCDHFEAARGDNAVTPDEEYLPSAAAFELCGDNRLREEAKHASTVVLTTLQNIFIGEQMAQSRHAPLGNQPNGLPIAQQRHPALPPNLFPDAARSTVSPTWGQNIQGDCAIFHQLWPEARKDLAVIRKQLDNSATSAARFRAVLRSAPSSTQSLA
jgi:hypothetical protein